MREENDLIRERRKRDIWQLCDETSSRGFLRWIHTTVRGTSIDHVWIKKERLNESKNVLERPPYMSKESLELESIV